MREETLNKHLGTELERMVWFGLDFFAVLLGAVSAPFTGPVGTYIGGGVMRKEPPSQSKDIGIMRRLRRRIREI